MLRVGLRAGKRAADKRPADKHGNEVGPVHIPGIGKILLLPAYEAAEAVMYKTHRVYKDSVGRENYLGYAREYSNGSWTFDRYPALWVHGTINSPFADGKVVT